MIHEYLIPFTWNFSAFTGWIFHWAVVGQLVFLLWEFFYLQCGWAVVNEIVNLDRYCFFYCHWFIYTLKLDAIFIFLSDTCTEMACIYFFRKSLTVQFSFLVIINSFMSVHLWHFLPLSWGNRVYFAPICILMQRMWWFKG